MKATSNSIASLIVCSSLALGALGGCGGHVDAGEQLGTTDEPVTASVCPESVPASLTPAADQRLWFVLAASGVQIYECRTSATGPAWTFVAPEADLFDPGGEQVGIHYAGPTWESDDGSKVVAARIAGAPAPIAGAIPWLLLGAVSHAGDGRMSNVTSIQRLNTAGGVAPASGCDADHLGAIAAVPYTAEYFFYKTNEGSADPSQCGG